MIRFKTKRVYEPAATPDGFRVLVDRFWPRGRKKESLRLDLWEKELAPSNSLRKWFHEDPQGNWEKFQIHYREELHHNPKIHEFLKKIRTEKTVTLLYGSKNNTENHAILLKEYLSSAEKKGRTDQR